MAHGGEHRTRSVPEVWQRPDEHLRKVAQTVNSLLRGESNNHFTVTLTPNATETEVRYSSARTGVVPVLQPLSAAGAAALASGSVYATAENGKVVIHHDADPSDQRTLGVVIVG